MRLYETLAAGRVPVLVDTDSPLPLTSHVRWNEHVVWVSYDRIRDIGRIVADFHSAHGADGLADVQRRNRTLWVQSLSMAGYLRSMHSILCALLAEVPSPMAEAGASALS